MAQKIALSDITGPIAAANDAGKASARAALDFDAGIDTAFGAGDGVLAETSGSKTKLSALAVDPASIFDVLTGEADRAPSPDLALWDWLSKIRTGTIVDNTATLDWPDDGAGAGYSSITLFEVSAAFSLVLPTLDVDMAAMGARRYQRAFLVRNVLLPTLNMSAGVTGVPLRLSPTPLLLGHYYRVTIDYYTPLGFASVNVTDLGDSLPPFMLQLLTNAAAPNTQISSFDPYLYLADRVVFMPVRLNGTAIVTPAGRGYTPKAGAGFDAAQDNRLLLGTTQSAKMLVSDARAADGQFGGTGQATNAQVVAAIAIRKGEFSQHGGLVGTDDTIEFSSFTGLPAGAVVYGFTLCAQNQNPRPVGATALLKPNGDLTEAWNATQGWFHSLWRASPMGGAWAPAPVTLGGAANWLSMSIVAIPT